MNSTNRASRDCGRTILKNLATGKFDLDIDTANSFTLNITSDTTPANKRGKRAIIFQKPMEGTVALELEVYPFEIYKMFGDGTVITQTGDYPHADSVKCREAGVLAVPENVKSLQVYSKGNLGQEDAEIEGTVEGTKFTATTASEIAVGSTYDIVYMAQGGKAIAINDDLQMSDYKLDTDIITKDELGVWSTEHVTCYKSTAQRNIELAYTADGDPASLTITFDLLTDENGDFVEIMTPESASGTTGE